MNQTCRDHPSNVASSLLCLKAVGVPLCPIDPTRCSKTQSGRSSGRLPSPGPAAPLLSSPPGNVPGALLRTLWHCPKPEPNLPSQKDGRPRGSKSCVQELKTQPERRNTIKRISFKESSKTCSEESAQNVPKPWLPMSVANWCAMKLQRVKTIKRVHRHVSSHPMHMDTVHATDTSGPRLLELGRRGRRLVLRGLSALKLSCRFWVWECSAKSTCSRQ